MTTWRFYGRKTYFKDILSIIQRGRWFFLKISGRRRIGKTALVQETLRTLKPHRSIFYVQLPDSEPTGMLSAVWDAIETFHIPTDRFPKPRSMLQLASFISLLAEDGYIIVLDEFQYLNRKGYEELCSHLQAAADKLSNKAHTITGGLIVLGSIHTEMAAILEDRSAPLYGRVTDSIELPHLDMASIVEILRDHADEDAERLLFLWNLFEGVPKFYRDCYEMGVLSTNRQALLRKIFFESSSPLRREAENWFLRELRGRYDIILKFVARHPGSMHGDLLQAIQDIDGGSPRQIGGYLQGLVERYRLIEKKLPIFAKAEARKNRYYLSDNFLQSWLAALAGPVSGSAFRPVEELVVEADDRLMKVEGQSLEKLVRNLYEERSRLGIGNFPLTHTVQGYWDRSDTEIDLIACNADTKSIRFISCKRSASKLIEDANNLKEHATRFLNAQSEYKSWSIEYAGVTPRLSKESRLQLKRHDVLGQDLTDLIDGLV